MTAQRMDRATDYEWDEALRGRCVALVWGGAQ